jgi:hypothetical protein
MVNPVDWEYKRGITILGISHGFASNVRAPIHNPIYFEPGEIFSQITNWEGIEEIEYTHEMGSHCLILDDSDEPFEVRREDNHLFVQGNITQLEREVKDRRWTLLGNVGLWVRHALAIQEQNGIFSLHAAAIYKPDENELFIVVGKAGSGKTVFLLEAISRGYQIFSTEMTYWGVFPGGIRFYRGAQFDNILAGTLLYDFPTVADRLEIDHPQVDDPWDHKISVDMRRLSTAKAEIDNPKLTFVFPKIEKGIKEAMVSEITDQNELARRLFLSASEKISGTFRLYDEYPVQGIDTAELAADRREAILELVAADRWEIKGAKSTLAGPDNCMEGIDQ